MSNKFVDDLSAMKRMTNQALLSLAEKASAHGETFEHFQRASIRRGLSAFLRHAGTADDVETDAGHAFVTVYALAERELLTSLLGALSTPAAKGRELEIIQAMRNGARIDEALATAGKGEKKGDEKRQDIPAGNVIALRPRSATK